MRPRSVFMVTLAMSFGVVAILLAKQMAARNYTYHGSLIEPPLAAFDFTLKDTSGDTFNLSDQRGKIVMLFFGYTHCPDVCPTTLSDFKKVHALIGEAADQVEFVFVTVDPARDTPQKVAQYVSAFHPSFIALTGAEIELQPIWEGYFVYRQKSDADSAAGYLMDHTARVYLIDPHGNLFLTFPFGLSADAMAQDVRHVLATSN